MTARKYRDLPKADARYKISGHLNVVMNPNRYFRNFALIMPKAIFGVKQVWTYTYYFYQVFFRLLKLFDFVVFDRDVAKHHDDRVLNKFWSRRVKYKSRRQEK